MSAQARLVRLAGHRVTVNGYPAEIVNNTVRWNRAMGTYFEFAEDHGGQWSEDGLTWRIDGKTIRFSETNHQHTSISTVMSKPAPAPTLAQWRVTSSATAWASIGHGGPFRIKGGCAVYDTVIHNYLPDRSSPSDAAGQLCRSQPCRAQTVQPVGGTGYGPRIPGARSRVDLTNAEVVL